MTSEELDELLKKVRARTVYNNTFSTLSDAERGAIIGAILPEIQRRIELALVKKKPRANKISSAV